MKLSRMQPPSFPLADLNEVKLFITPYMDDPRNINARFAQDSTGKELIEYEITFTLPPHPLDPTKEPIYVWGHVDFVKHENGMFLVDDLKTGKKTGWEMIHDYAIQVAAYTYGVRQLGIPALPGRIIRNRGYRTRENKGVSPDGVYFNMPFRVEDLETILEPVQLEVALIRLGHVRFGTGPHCTFCEFGGLTGCLKQWKQLTKGK